jgi:hypothetical protein
LVDEAEGGNQDAQIKVAWNYFYGDNGFPVNYEESTKFFRLAADQGVPEALQMMGEFHAIGIARPRSFIRARELFEQAAKSGLDSARSRYGLFLEWWNRKIATSRRGQVPDPGKYGGIAAAMAVCASSGGIAAFDYRPYLNGKDAESLYRLGTILEPPKTAKVCKALENAQLIHCDLDGALRCYREATLLGNLEAFRRMLHVMRELGQHTQITDTYLFQYLCLAERTVVRKVCEILPPTHQHYKLATSSLLAIDRSSIWGEPSPRERCKDLMSSMKSNLTSSISQYYGPEVAGYLVELTRLFTEHNELVYKHIDKHGKRFEYQGPAAIDFLYRLAIHQFGCAKDGGTEGDRKKAMKPSVLAYARWLKTQHRYAAMFRQYNKLSQPPKSSKIAVFKTGKYLLAPKRKECVPNAKLGMDLLRQSIAKGFARAAFHIGRYQIQKNKWDEGLDSLILAFRMGCIRGLFSYIDTVNDMGGPRRYPGQHFSMLLEAYRGLTHTLHDHISDKKKFKALTKDLKACKKRLSSAQYVKYQWREGLRLLSVSTEDARFFLEFARDNHHEKAAQLFLAERKAFREHRCGSTEDFGLYENRPCCCDVCGTNEEVPKMHCSKCCFDVCMVCVGGIYLDRT